jgi:beta-galactosidase
LTSHPDNGTFGVYTDTHDLAVTTLSGPLTTFYVVRHGDLASLDSTQYKLYVDTSLGHLTLPQLGGWLTLNGRDSKFHVVDYDIGGINLIYSTAEVFSWKKSGSKSVLLLYGGENEMHEFALPVSLGAPSYIEGRRVRARRLGASIVIQWHVDSVRRIINFGHLLEIHLLWRNEAYNYWVLDLPAPQPVGLHVSPSRADKSVIVKAGYLIRSAKINGDALYLTGDINRTTEVEVISTPTKVSSLFFNGKEVKVHSNNDRLTGLLSFVTPCIVIPDLEALTWRYIDSLPELSCEYSDDSWTSCDHTESHNPRNLSTPASLYASDYGYNAGSLLYRGHFVANGTESSLYLLTEGGYAFGHSVWLNSTYLGSWPGDPAAMFYNQTLLFPMELQRGKPYVLTVLIDHMGLDENFPANVQIMKDPRGILDYDLKGRDKSAISWKVTGNLGGEQYYDLSRGPLNEGAMYGERQGYHLPGAPVSQWHKKSPISDGISGVGVGFFTTSFDLQIPAGYDVPISIVFKRTVMETPTQYRVQIYVNGWQFGKYGK